MFQLLSEIGFRMIQPFVVAVLNKKLYPKDAIKRKFADFEENFSKENDVIMVHGVSVGEINALENLVKRIRQEFPDSKIVLTTGTHTGQDIAHKKLENYTDLITYFPFDCPSIVRKFLDKVNPKKVLIAETEIWPNFAYECSQRGIKLYVINGRISDSTFKSYYMFRFVFKKFLNLYSGIFTQSEDDNNKFLKLGANIDTTKKMNNLKFDIKAPEVNFEFNKSGCKVLLAGSTHQGEDEVVLNVFKKLKTNHSDLKLLLAPRHLTRIDEIKELLKKYNLSFDLRSNGRNNFDGNDVLLLDTLGELSKMYAFSDISFIGGSFNKTGGHNPLESIVFSKPVISGPSIHNFKDIYAIIKKANAGFVVKDEIEFYEVAEKMISDEEFYNRSLESSSKVFAEQQGALDFVIDVLRT